MGLGGSVQNEDWEDDALWPSSPAEVMWFGVYALIGLCIIAAAAIITLSLG